MAGRAKGLGEGDLAVSVGGRSDVVIADVVEVVVDGDRFAGEGGAAIEGGGEGDPFIDGGGGGGRFEGGGGGLAAATGDVEGYDAAR